MVGRHLHERTASTRGPAASARRSTRQNRDSRDKARRRPRARRSCAAATAPAGALPYGGAQASRNRARARDASRSSFCSTSPPPAAIPWRPQEIEAIIRGSPRDGHHRGAGRARHAPGDECLRSHPRARQRPHAGGRNSRRGARQSGGDRGLSRNSRRAGEHACCRLRTSEAVTAGSKCCTASRSRSRPARSSRSSAAMAPARPP